MLFYMYMYALLLIVNYWKLYLLRESHISLSWFSCRYFGLVDWELWNDEYYGREENHSTQRKALSAKQETTINQTHIMALRGMFPTRTWWDTDSLLSPLHQHHPTQICIEISTHGPTTTYNNNKEKYFKCIWSHVSCYYIHVKLETYGVLFLCGLVFLYFRLSFIQFSWDCIQIFVRKVPNFLCNL